LDYSGVLEGGGKNRQHDDNHHDHDDEEEGASQQHPKRCGDVTLVGEPVSPFVSFTSSFYLQGI